MRSIACSINSEAAGGSRSSFATSRAWPSAKWPLLSKFPNPPLGASSHARACTSPKAASTSRRSTPTSRDFGGTMTSLGNRESRRDDAVDRLSDLARAVAHAPIDPELDRAGRARLLFNMRRELERPAHRFALPLALAAALVALLAVGGHRLWPKPLVYEVRGASLDGPYVSASEKPVRVEFSDGSVVRGEPGSRLRVDDTRSDGARVLIERGRAAVKVTHSPGSTWSFLGGPFEVRVTGTRFELEWDPAGEVLELGMSEGSVEVHGPLGGAVTVRAGQRFRAELATRRMTVVDAEEEVAANAPRPDAPTPTPSDPPGAESQRALE